MLTRVLVLAAACFASGAALKCYLCSSEDGGYCSDSQIWKGTPVECDVSAIQNVLDSVDTIAQGLGIDIDSHDNFHRTSTRLQGSVACLKIYYSNPNGRGYTERKCVIRDENTCNGAGRETLFGRMDHCRTCTFDGCNSAGRPGVHYLWLLPLLGLLRWC